MLRDARTSLFVALLLACGLPTAGSQAKVEAPVQPSEDSATGMIVGQVVDAGTGRPVSGAIVSYSGPPPPRPPVRAAATSPPRILTGPDGYFVFRGLRAGNYGISAQKPGYATGAFVSAYVLVRGNDPTLLPKRPRPITATRFRVVSGR